MKAIKKCLLFSSAALLFSMSACKKSSTTETPVEDTKANSKAGSSISAVPNFKVVGYMPSWAGDVNQVQYSKLTHVNYAFVLPTSTGGLAAVENPSKLQSLVTLSHNNGKKVLISVGGWNGGDDSAFRNLAANSTYRNNFVNNLVNFCNQYGLDGVDIDWEYPDPGSESTNYTALMSQLSSAMHSRGKLLTAAVVAEGYTGDGVSSTVFGYVDYLNIMAYDGPLPNHSTYDYALQAVNYWKGRGLPIAKAILGLPFYGRSSTEEVDYKDILARGGSAYSDSFNGIGYNGITTIKNKTNWAYDNAGGVMIWDLNADATGANSLLTAINQAIVAKQGGGGTTPPIGQTVTFKGNNNAYVCSENGTQAMTCVRTPASTWEQFTVVDAGGGKVALRSMGKYVSSENGTQSMTCNRTSFSTWEMFDWIKNSDGTISLRGSNGAYVSSENGIQAMTCVRTAAPLGGWETFRLNQ